MFRIFGAVSALTQQRSALTHQRSALYQPRPAPTQQRSALTQQRSALVLQHVFRLAEPRAVRDTFAKPRHL